MYPLSAYTKCTVVFVPSGVHCHHPRAIRQLSFLSSRKALPNGPVALGSSSHLAYTTVCALSCAPTSTSTYRGRPYTALLYNLATIAQTRALWPCMARCAPRLPS